MHIFYFATAATKVSSSIVFSPLEEFIIPYFFQTFWHFLPGFITQDGQKVDDFKR
jgi:hypothetical protein